MFTRFVMDDGKGIKCIEWCGKIICLDSRLSVERTLALFLCANGIHVSKTEHYSDTDYQNMIESFDVFENENGK